LPSLSGYNRRNFLKSALAYGVVESLEGWPPLAFATPVIGAWCF